MIINCHCHAWKGDGCTGPRDTAAPLDKYLVRAAQAGITDIVLFAAFHSGLCNQPIELIRRREPRQCDH
jgi:uncharacterized protein